MSLTYVEVTEAFGDGSGSPITGTVTFTPSATVYASGVPLLTAGVPVQAQIASGQLKNLAGGTLQLLATDNDVTVEGQTGFWFWTVQVTINGQPQAAWSFFLPSSPSTVDLYSLANTGAGGGGGGGGFSNPMTAIGDLIDGGTSGTAQRLAGNTTTTRKFLRSAGTGSVATAPAWDTLQAGDIPALAYDASGAAATAQSNAEAYADANKLAKSANLSDVASASTARTNLGLGSAAIHASTDFDAAGAAAAAQSAAEAASVPIGDLPLSLPNGGTGQTTQQAALDALAGAVTSGLVLRGNGTHVLLAALQAADIPNLTESQITNLVADLASKAALAGATFTGYLAPAVSALTFGASIAVNAALGNVFTVTLTSSAGTIQNPANPVDGQIIRFRIAQDATGSRTVAWGTAYDFGSGSAPTLTTTASKTDVVAFEYNAALSKWMYLGAAIPQGF